MTAVGRRAVLVGGAVVAGGGIVGGAVALRPDRPAVPVPTAGGETVAFHGPHQAGITTPAQAHAVFTALDLRPGSGPGDVRRLLRMLTDDAGRLTAGRPPLEASDPELPALPSRLTVTFGFGPGLFDVLGRGGECPAVLRDLPAFATDRLDPRWSGGDLLLQVCSDDPLPLSYALRRLVRSARSIATVRWTQRGFGPARGSEPAGTTPRNLMGQRRQRPGRQIDVDPPGIFRPKDEDERILRIFLLSVEQFDSNWEGGTTTAFHHRGPPALTRSSQASTAASIISWLSSMQSR